MEQVGEYVTNLLLGGQHVERQCGHDNSWEISILEGNYLPGFIRMQAAQFNIGIVTQKKPASEVLESFSPDCTASEQENASNVSYELFKIIGPLQESIWLVIFTPSFTKEADTYLPMDPSTNCGVQQVDLKYTCLFYITGTKRLQTTDLGQTSSLTLIISQTDVQG